MVPCPELTMTGGWGASTAPGAGARPGRGARYPPGPGPAWPAERGGAPPRRCGPWPPGTRRPAGWRPGPPAPWDRRPPGGYLLWPCPLAPRFRVARCGSRVRRISNSQPQARHPRPALAGGGVHAGRRDRPGKLEDHARAAGAVVLVADLAPVLGHDLVYDGQPQAGAGALGGEVGEEQAVAVLGGHAPSRVRHFQGHPARAVGAAGADPDLSTPP